MKNDIRKQMMAQRKALSKDEKLMRDTRIIEQIKKDIDFQQAKTVALFYPMPSEIDLRPLLKEKKQFLFPKVIGNDMTFYVYHQNMQWEKSKFGVLEPKDEKPYEGPIDYMLAPALAIDTQYARIGYGKGYYDRFLKKHRPKRVIGVVYDFQVIKHIETSKHDQTLDGYLKG